MAENRNIEESLEFLPQFDKNGLLPVISQESKTGQILMVGYMNKQAMDMTIQTGRATYFSRSRQKIWQKGEQSGHVQRVEQILVDCDQDCLVLKVSIDAGQCHVGYKSCFYRALSEEADGKLRLIAEKVYDPKDVYK